MMPRRNIQDPQWATVRAARAADTRARPTGLGVPDMLSPVLAQPSAGEDADAAERYSAAVKVADLALELHPCELDPDDKEKVCTHPDHERDREWVRTALSLLALPDEDDPEPVETGPDEPVEEEPREPRKSRSRPRPSLGWHERAACSGADVDLFYGYDGEPRSDRAFRVTVAKQICADCPVRVQCLEHALTYPERHGVWGGLDEDELAQEHNRRLKRERSNRARERAAARQKSTSGRGYAA